MHLHHRHDFNQIHKDLSTLGPEEPTSTKSTPKTFIAGGASWRWWSTWRPIPCEAAAQIGLRVSALGAEVWAIWAVLRVGWDLGYLFGSVFIFGLGFKICIWTLSIGSLMARAKWTYYINNVYIWTHE
ncbi:hypothetical protein ES288_A02G156000v1 [Gossypium darwinii]|uniref:Uncharacterized protein n=1 Tax=Gossypium darwinii TaxID=34276 RepID=A0A5D2HGE7_GOSDA|nr:hypothetical protein ES288_A02G156000v1 [Gossypium darwinii]